MRNIHNPIANYLVVLNAIMKTGTKPPVAGVDDKGACLEQKQDIDDNEDDEEPREDEDDDIVV